MRSDGATMKQHLAQVESATGKARIEEPEIPAAGEHLWQWFWEIGSGRGPGGFGPEALSYQEIDAWTRLTGWNLTSWEVSAIKMMDQAYLRGVSEVAKEERQRNGPRRT